MINKSQNQVRKELDLQKFIQRQRVLITALLGFLKPHQNWFVHKFSRLTIKERSEGEASSSDREFSDSNEQKERFVNRIFLCQTGVDQRFFNMLNMRCHNSFGHSKEQHSDVTPFDQKQLSLMQQSDCLSR